MNTQADHMLHWLTAIRTRLGRMTISANDDHTRLEFKRVCIDIDQKVTELLQKQQEPKTDDHPPQRTQASNS